MNFTNKKKVKTWRCKTYVTLILTLLLAVGLNGCSSDDNNGSGFQNPLLGQWEITSGFLIFGNDTYANFNSDNTVDILRLSTENFKGASSPDYNISANEIIIDGAGGQGDPGTFRYSIEEDILTLSDDFRTIILQRLDNGPLLSNWMQELSRLSEGDAPWEGEIDMAFTHDKSKIVYGKSNASDHIGLINPNTFEEVGQIETTHNARAVEIEKFNAANRYVFQSDGGSDQFYGYTEDLNELSITSAELGAWIKGLASINGTEICAASSNGKRLYLYNYIAATTNDIIELSIQPQGLDYQNGFLYISDDISIHKCQVSPDFQVLESYYVPNLAIDGIAFDGTNFWVNGYDFVAESYKIVKTNLTL